MTDVLFYNATILVSVTRSLKLNPYRLALMQSRLSASIHPRPFRPSSLEMKIKRQCILGVFVVVVDVLVVFVRCRGLCCGRLISRRQMGREHKAKEIF